MQKGRPFAQIVHSWSWVRIDSSARGQRLSTLHPVPRPAKVKKRSRVKFAVRKNKKSIKSCRDNVQCHARHTAPWLAPLQGEARGGCRFACKEWPRCPMVIGFEPSKEAQQQQHTASPPPVPTSTSCANRASASCVRSASASAKLTNFIAPAPAASSWRERAALAARGALASHAAPLRSCS